MEAPRDPTIGRLVLVATPIGNLDDLSPRAAATLAAADVVACEDTRRTGKLLHLRGIEAPMVTLHDHNEAQMAPQLLDRVRAGQLVVVVSDAGTPGISDPGYEVVRMARAERLPVTAIPGPAAFVHALVTSGLPTARFAFEGFLPRKAGARRQRLAGIAADDRTLVFYVAPHRAVEDLEAMVEAFGADRPAAVARELTKLHEQVVTGTLAELAQSTATEPPRGEVTVVVGPAPPSTTSYSDEALRARVTELTGAGMSTRDAVKQVVQETGEPKRRVYDLATR